jgi:exopolysaccharide biosynthesis polyprenyl glycosylphosphotransferase
VKRERGAPLLLALADALLVAGAFVLGWALRFRLGLGEVTHDSAPLRPYLELLAFAVVIFHVVFRSRGLYDTGLASSLGVQVVERTLGAVVLSLAIVLAATFFYRDVTYSRSALPFAGAAAMIGLPLPRLFLIVRRRARRRAGLDIEPALIIARPEKAQALAEKLKDEVRFGLRIVAVLSPAPVPVPIPVPVPVPDFSPHPDSPPASPGEGDGLDELESVIRAQGIREVLIGDELGKDELVRTIETCEELDVEPRIVPSVYDLCITASDFLDLDGVPFISIRERRFERFSLALKRVFDVVLAALLLVATFPILMACVVAVRLGSKGRAFFGQRRVGENGRVFTMWKLRSMTQDAEARLGEVVDVDGLREPVFKVENDPRVTPVGRFLRRTSLDELPQLWNVLKGDMSLVGPRPEEEKIVARYDRNQRRRLKAKPGITGLQQVEARGIASLDKRIQLDVIYIRRRTLVFDLWILARTVHAVLSGRGAT